MEKTLTRMQLPELPKQNKKKEADFGVRFRHYMESTAGMPIGSYELKDTKGLDYLNFKDVEPSQVAYAHMIESEKGAFIRVQGLKGEPDYIYLKLTDAFLVINYPKFFCILYMNDFVRESQISKRKSLTSSRAAEIAWKVM